MRLLKVAFWIGLVVLLLPSDEAQQARIYQNASAAIERATTFCDRNQRTCETASTVWAVFLKKLEIAARMGYDLATADRGDTAARYEPAGVRTERAIIPPRPIYDEQTPAWRR